MENELTVQDSNQIQATPAHLLQLAVNQGADLDKLEKLMDLQERWEKNEARKAYVQAMSDFKASPPEITKDKHVEHGNTKYDHATLANVTNTINAALSQHGLSSAWKTDQADKMITVTCTITHVGGHSESTSLTAGADTSGSKNPIQAIGSAITYLQRYSLLSLTGLAAKGQDDDGRTEPIETITEDQVTVIFDLGAEVNADFKLFLQYFKVEKVEDLRVSDYDRAVKMLEAKRKK